MYVRVTDHVYGCIVGGEGSEGVQAHPSGQLFPTGAAQSPQLFPREQVDYEGLVNELPEWLLQYCTKEVTS